MNFVTDKSIHILRVNINGSLVPIIFLVDHLNILTPCLQYILIIALTVLKECLLLKARENHKIFIRKTSRSNVFKYLSF